MGLYRRGNKWYGLYTDALGMTKRISLSSDKACAMTKLGQIQMEIEQQKAGILPINARMRTLLCEEVKLQYVQYMLGQGRSQNTLTAFDQAWKVLIEEPKLLAVKQVTMKGLEEWIAEASKRLSNQTINLHITLARGAFAWAAENKMIAENPWSTWHRLKESKARERRDLSGDEIGKIVSILPNLEWKARFLLFIYTGLRNSAGTGIEWKWINWEEKLIVLPVDSNKSKKEHRIPMHPALVPVLLEWRAAQDVVRDSVFPALTTRQVLRRIKEFVAEAGLDPKGVCVHSLRHTLATQVYRAAGLKAAQEILGHASIATTSKYLHVSDDEKRKAIEAVKYGTA